ncbi:MAG: DUF4870 domain-containing protein [Acidobacteriota bacterium]|nr:MAG: DUF4870 domain-containing protein [Acidobacteriota bacterium]
MENQKSALGLDGNITALIGYIIGIVALILIFIEKDNKFVRFHAFQSVLYTVGFVVVYVVAMILITVITVMLGAMSDILGLIGSLLYLLLFVVWLAWLIGLIMAAVKSYGGNMWKLPIVGNLAEKWSS